MKKVVTILFVLFTIATYSTKAQNCPCHQISKCETPCSDVKEDDSKVQVLYFHQTRRCATCQAVEEVTKTTVTEEYGKEVTFKSINIEKEKELAKKYGVHGQSLLVVKGKEKYNLTNVGFMYARNQPQRLKSKLITTIKSLK